MQSLAIAAIIAALVVLPFIPCHGDHIANAGKMVDTTALHDAHRQASAWHDSAMSYARLLDSMPRDTIYKTLLRWRTTHDTDTLETEPDTVEAIRYILKDDSVCHADREGARLIASALTYRAERAEKARAMADSTIAALQAATPWKAYAVGFAAGFGVGVVGRSLIP